MGRKSRVRWRNFRFHLTGFLGWIILLPLWVRIRNKHLVQKYPFLDYSDPYGYDQKKKEGFFEKYASTWNDILPRGWRKKFGKDLWRDLLIAIKEDGFDPKEIIIEDCKEKYGTLRLYLNRSGDKMDEVISYYEDMSMLFCIFCGRPTKYFTYGWVTYICDKCGRKTDRKELLTTDDIPYRERWEKDREPVRIETKVPFEKYWPKPNKDVQG